MHEYDPQQTYAPGEFVLHNDKLYQKLDDGDNSAPDDVPGGWGEIPKSNTNLDQYLAIEANFHSYEERRNAHQAKVAADKASAVAKLEALGLTVDELHALGL
jgi:hypothetical protein